MQTAQHHSMNTIQIIASALYTYPVKACAPCPVDRLDFDDDGLLLGDRAWAVVDEQSSVVWQGSHPRLALVMPELTDGVLFLRNPDGHRVEINQAPDCSPCQIQIWNNRTKRNDLFAATDEGAAAAEFLRRTVGARGLRLVRLGREARCREGVNPVHIVSSASVEEFNDELARTGHAPASIERFRPNLVISAPPGDEAFWLPFMEEHFTSLDWTDEAAQRSSLVIGDLCVRCVVPNVDPASASVDDRVLQTVGSLSAQRHPGKPVYFGVYAKTPAARTALRRGAVLTAQLAF